MILSTLSTSIIKVLRAIHAPPSANTYSNVQVCSKKLSQTPNTVYFIDFIITEISKLLNYIVISLLYVVKWPNLVGRISKYLKTKSY